MYLEKGRERVNVQDEGVGTDCKLARFFSPKISKTSVFNRQAGRQATIVPYNVPEKRVVRK